MRTASGSPERRMPSRVMFLAVTGRRTKDDAVGDWYSESLAYAVAITLRRERGKWCRLSIHICTTTDEVHSLICEQTQSRQTLYVYGHGLGRILGMVDFWAQLRNGVYNVAVTVGGSEDSGSVSESCPRGWIGSVILSDPPTFLRLRTAKGIVEFCDSMNYLRVAAEELCGLACVRKHALPAEMGEVDHEVRKLIQEARGVLVFVTGLIDRWAAGRYGPWQFTAASLAWSAFQHSFGGRGLFPSRDDGVKLIERAAYYGGRTTTWWTGQIRWRQPGRDEYYGDVDLDREPFLHGPVTLVDMRSAYGWAMAEVPTPVSMERVVNPNSVVQLEKMMAGYGAIAVVRVRSETEAYCYRRGGQTVEAIGDFWTVLADPELRPAIQRGHVTAVSIAHLYRCGRPLALYARHWLRLRAEAESAGDRTTVALCKIMLNSLYGRFALMSPRWILDRSLPVVRNWGHYHVCNLRSRSVLTCRSLGSISEYRAGHQEHPASFPAVAAWITAAVRERMRTMRAVAGVSSTLLCRTDSLLVLSGGVSRLIDAGLYGQNPGQMRVVAGPTCDCTVYSADHYYCGGHAVQVGVTAGSAEVELGVFACEKWESPEAALSHKTGPTARLRIAAVRLGRSQVEHGQDYRGWQPVPRRTAAGTEPMPPPSEMVGLRSLAEHRAGSPDDRPRSIGLFS